MELKDKIAKKLNKHEDLEKIIDEAIEDVAFEEFKELEKKAEEVKPEQELLTSLLNIDKSNNACLGAVNKLHNFIIHELNGENGLKKKQDKTNFLLTHTKKLIFFILVIFGLNIYMFAINYHESLVKPFALDIAKYVAKKTLGSSFNLGGGE